VKDRLTAVISLGLTLTLCGCGSKSPTTPTTTPTPAPGAPVTVASIALAGLSSVVGIGQAVKLTANARMSDGTTQDVSLQATWSSSNPSVATVSSSGLVTPQGVGSSDITATYQGQTTRVTFSVSPQAFTPQASSIIFRNNFDSEPLGPLATQSNSGSLPLSRPSSSSLLVQDGRVGFSTQVVALGSATFSTPPSVTHAGQFLIHFRMSAGSTGRCGAGLWGRGRVAPAPFFTVGHGSADFFQGQIYVDPQGDSRITPAFAISSFTPNTPDLVEIFVDIGAKTFLAFINNKARASGRMEYEDAINRGSLSLDQIDLGCTGDAAIDDVVIARFP
jgi:hypothetical protein